jgi:signal transduction histidine kinase
VISAVYLAGALILTRVSLASTALGHPGQPFFVRLFGVVIPVAGGLAQTYRLRRPAGAEQRQQSRLLLSALLPMLLAGIVFLVLPSIEGGARTQHLGLAVFPALFAVIPVALAVGVLRYRLWDIDVVVNRALLFATLAGSIGAIYVAVVVGLGDVLGGRSNSRWLSIVALATVAVAIEPARRRLQIVANRLVYGTRSAPADVIERAGRQLAQSSTDALDRLAVVVADGVAATRVDVWIRVGSKLITTASAPGQAPVERREIHGDAVPVIPGRHCVPVHSQGRLVGLLAVAKRPGETITRAEGRLLADVASQAQLVMRNAQLTAELGAQLEVLSAHAVALQETRRRVVTLQDEERRRIERDIHDGAQQHLVALAVQLGLARAAVAESPTEARTQLPEAQGAFRDAIASLHDLARGIYPAVLVDDGIAPALQMQAERLGLEVRMDVSGSARPPAAVESAVYFACAEALQNVAKHARATTVDVVLREESDELRFTVGDDGVGFDVGPGGSGIVNMADRIKTLGGSLSVWSEPGGGTTVQGVVPLAEINP